MRSTIFDDFDFPYNEFFLPKSVENKDDCLLPKQIISTNALPSNSFEVLPSTNVNQRYESFSGQSQTESSASTRYFLNPDSITPME